MKTDKHYWLTGRILQNLYDSEINFSMGWMWDGGVDYKDDADLIYITGEVKSTGERDIGNAMLIIADDVSKKYPDSNFAKWWADVDRERLS